MCGYQGWWWGGTVIYADIGPAVLILALTAEVEEVVWGGWGPDEKRRRLITVSTDPGMLT